MLFNKNDKAVSPVVATLVLIVVAIIGAAAVGALLGAFSGNVGQQANAQGTSSASSTTLSVVGSTTMQPASEKLATAYEKDHQGVQINVQGGGSGAGITAVGQGVADIGSSSRAIKTTEMTTYPDLKSYEVGACAACFITGSGVTVSPTNGADQTADLMPIFAGGSPSANVTGATHVYTRSDSSGTKDTVSSWLKAVNSSFTISSGTIGEPGSQAMEDAVGGDSNGIGYVDYGFTIGDPKVKVVQIAEEQDVFGRKTLGSGGVITANPVPGALFNAAGTTSGTNNILKELQTDQTNTNVGHYYPEGLIQPLYYITNGAPNTLEQSFIDYARSPEGSTKLNAVNYFGITQYK